MTKKINWQEHNHSDKKNLRWRLAGGWAGHSAKMLLCLSFVFIAAYYLVLPQMQVNYFFASTRCLVMGSKTEPLSKQVNNSGFQPKFLVIYEVNEKIYTNWAYDILNNIFTNPAAAKTVRTEFKTGNYYMCWYNKANPHQVVLKRGWDYLSLIFFFITLVVFTSSVANFYRWHSKNN